MLLIQMIISLIGRAKRFHMKNVFDKFTELLEERFDSNIHTTEDSVRYTFFLALLNSGYCKHTDIIL